MPMIPLFGLGQQGKSPVVTAQRHLNLYAEIKQDGERSQVSFYGTPGLALFVAFGDTPVRGAIAVGDFIYCVHRGTFWEVNNAGVKVMRGSLGTTSGRVSLAYNGTQIAMVDGSAMYCYTIATNAFATVASDLFVNPIDITYLDGYGIACFRNSQQYQISALGDFLTWDALEFASAESSPDGLLRVLADHGELLLAGSLTIEFAANTGGQDFPFSTMKSSTLEFGLAAPWSLVKYNDSLAGLFKNEMGQVQVMMMRGHALTPISTEEIDTLINGYDTVSDATAYSYMLGGHPMYQINFPSAGKSWLYDSKTGLWTSLESGLNGDRHRGEIRVDFLNKPRITDFENGNIYTLDPNTYTDNGTPIPREIVSRHLHQGGQRFSVSALQIFFETGTGLISGQGSDPQAMLQVSKDGGRTWGNERWVDIGAIGKYLTRAMWRRFGSAYDFVFKVRVTDPVKVVMNGESVEM